MLLMWTVGIYIVLPILGTDWAGVADDVFISKIKNYYYREVIEIPHEEYACKLETSSCLDGDDQICLQRSHVIPSEFHLSIDREQFRWDFKTQATANITYSNENLNTDIIGLKNIDSKNFSINTISIDGSHIYDGSSIIEIDPVMSPLNEYYSNEDIINIDNRATGIWRASRKDNENSKYFRTCRENTWLYTSWNEVTFNSGRDGFDDYISANGWDGFELIYSKDRDDYRFEASPTWVTKDYYLSALLLGYIDDNDRKVRVNMPEVINPILASVFDSYMESYEKIASQGRDRVLLENKILDWDYSIYIYDQNHAENLRNLYNGFSNQILDSYIDAVETAKSNLSQGYRERRFISGAYDTEEQKRSKKEEENALKKRIEESIHMDMEKLLWINQSGSRRDFINLGYAYLMAKKNDEMFFLLDDKGAYPHVYYMPHIDVAELESIAKIPSHEMLKIVNKPKPENFRWCINDMVLNRNESSITVTSAFTENPYSRNLSSLYQCKQMPEGSIEEMNKKKIKKLRIP